MAVTWEDVVAVALRWPAVEETTSYGTPSLKLGKKLLARVNEKDHALVLKTTDLEEKAALLEGRPDVFFTTPHYEGYPAVLARWDALERPLLEELVEDAWRTAALKKHLALLERLSGLSAA